MISSSECVISRIGRRRTFDELRSDGRRVRTGSVRLNFLALETSEVQVAFAIGRSFGNAVERNRGRRRLRAAFIEALGRTEVERMQGAFLLTGSRGLLTNDFSRLVDDVEACLKKLASEKCST
ncbi:MAG: ribonuclease P protein component [Acidimicrobiales bacterium]